MKMEVPASIRPFIIGSGGRNLKSIMEETGTQVQVPKREGNTEDSVVENGQDEALIALDIYGDVTGCSRARALIQAIVSERAAKTVRRLTAQDIPLEFWPLLNGSKGSNINELIQRVGASTMEGAPGEGATVYIPNRYVLRQMNGTQSSAHDEDDSVNEESKKKDVDIVISGERSAVERVTEGILNEAAELVRLVSD